MNNLKIYTYPGILENGPVDVVASPLTARPDGSTDELRQRLRNDSMVSGYPGFVEAGLMERSHALEYARIVEAAACQSDDPDQRQLIGYTYESLPIGFVQYGNAAHRSSRSLDDVDTRTDDAIHVTAFNIPHRPEDGEDDRSTWVQIGAVMAHATLLHSMGAGFSNGRYRVVEGKRAGYQQLLTEYHVPPSIITEYQPDEGRRFPGASAEERAGLKRYLQFFPLKPVLDALEYRHPQLRKVEKWTSTTSSTKYE